MKKPVRLSFQEEINLVAFSEKPSTLSKERQKERHAERTSDRKRSTLKVEIESEACLKKERQKDEQSGPIKVPKC